MKDKQEEKVRGEETGVAFEDMPPEGWRKAFMRRTVMLSVFVVVFAVGQIGALDFGAFNDTIKGIADIRFDTLKESIAALEGPHR